MSYFYFFSVCSVWFTPCFHVKSKLNSEAVWVSDSKNAGRNVKSLGNAGGLWLFIGVFERNARNSWRMRVLNSIRTSVDEDFEKCQMAGRFDKIANNSLFKVGIFWNGNWLCNFRGFICHYLRPHFLEKIVESLVAHLMACWLTCSMLNALPSPKTLNFHLPIQSITINHQFLTSYFHPQLLTNVSMHNFSNENSVTQPLLTFCRGSHTSGSYVPRPKRFAPVRGPGGNMDRVRVEFVSSGKHRDKWWNVRFLFGNTLFARKRVKKEGEGTEGQVLRTQISMRKN